ncbi:MAG: aldehyde dehydrogenase family protein [Pusillimonas sp.]
MKVYDRHYIGGQWVVAASGAYFDVHDSSTEEIMARVPRGTADEASEAVHAARAAFGKWSALPVEERCRYLDMIVDGLSKRQNEMAITISREVGTPIRIAAPVQVGGPIYHWKSAAKIARSFQWETKVAHSTVYREPIGVVGCITPWNFPLNQITLKVAPALAAGCTVVLKPSEVAPINALILAEVIDEAGLPPGVFNLVNGSGPEVGEILASHPEVDMVSFTGSTRAGKRVAALAAHTVKRVALELGGKSSSIVLPDADLPSAVKGTLSACMLNNGQTCSAHTRMLVHESQFDAVADLVNKAAARLTVGPSLEESTRVGPLASLSQRDRVMGHIKSALEGGAEPIVMGSKAFERGYFVEPSIFRVTPENTIANEEVFGPVLAVLTYKDEDEAVELANATHYGLAGGVWGSDVSHATAVARQLRTGQVDINGAPFNMKAPFGGYKQSGLGREIGIYGFEEFLEYKSVQYIIENSDG